MEQTAIQELVVTLQGLIEDKSLSDYYRAGIRTAQYEAKMLLEKERLQLEKTKNNTII
jgi:hypothetical protein